MIVNFDRKVRSILKLAFMMVNYDCEIFIATDSSLNFKIFLTITHNKLERSKFVKNFIT